MKTKKEPRAERYLIEDLLDFYSGAATPAFLEALRDPNSEASKLLRALQAVSRHAHRIDPESLVKALLERENPPPSNSRADTAQFLHGPKMQGGSKLAQVRPSPVG